MFDLALPDVPRTEPTLMLCRELGIQIDENELAHILSNVCSLWEAPRHAVVWRIARQMYDLRCPPKQFAVTAESLARRAQELDWLSPRFFGYDELVQQEAAYLLVKPLTMQSEFAELVAPLIHARTHNGCFPHIAPLSVALIEAFLWRCVLCRPEVNAHLADIIAAILYTPPYRLTSALFQILKDITEADDDK